MNTKSARRANGSCILSPPFSLRTQAESLIKRGIEAGFWYLFAMFARWIFVLLLSTSFVGAIPRPETKATLRSLARLPRMQPRFSLDFDADRGFAAFDTSRDPSIVETETREKLTGGPGEAKPYLEIATLRNAANDANAARDFQRAADGFRRRLENEPSNARLRIDLATALHGIGRASEAESLFHEAIRMAP